jgi:hypothetical protein
MVQGRDFAGQPALHLPLQIQLVPAGQNGELQYMLLQLTGTLLNSPLGEFATFQLGPLAEGPNPTPFYRPCNSMVVLDRQRVKRFEDARSGKDAYFQIKFAGLVWCPAQKKFEAPTSSGYLDILIPKSHWAENVVAKWNLDNIKVVEIEFPKSAIGENFRVAYARVEEAGRLFADAQYKQALTSLRLSFEGLAKSFGFGGAGKDFFDHLLVDLHPDKREKAREALAGLYRFLHLGPHELVQTPEATEQPAITRNDARFALVMTYAVFEYITSQN